MSTLVVVGLFYAIGVVLYFIVGLGAVHGAPNDHERRDGARLALASPLWPYLLIRMAIHGFVNLNRLADWKK